MKSLRASTTAEEWWAASQRLCQTDLFYLLVFVLGRTDANNDWVFERCREVQQAPNGHLDLWAREHYKSTIITFALTIQDILRDPEITVGIFSHTRPIAKGFLRQIKREFEANELLKALFPDVLYANPGKEAPKWSEDDGIVVKRKSNPKESTVEAWGLVDGQPTSKHFKLRIYDDAVTRESVTTPEQIAKTTEAIELSDNLGSEGGAERFIGTRYHFADSYGEMMRRQVVTPRIYAATVDGSVEGEPRFMSRDRLDDKRRKQGPYTFACFEATTRVLMGDWTEKAIADVEVGDVVAGYVFGNGKRARLAPAKVEAKNSRMADAVRFTFESGRSVVCTPDHKFWQGRAERGYAPLGFGRGQLRGACSIYEPASCDVSSVPGWAIGYIGGFFDGEGCATGCTFHFAQDAEKNGPCCSALERALDAAGLPYNVTTPTARPTHRDYYLVGGRETKIRFARMMVGFGKQERVAAMIFANGARNIGKGARDKLVSVEPVGEIEVWNIQTSTGNYVANGYAAKNCQMLQNPVADNKQGFQEAWLKYWRPDNWMAMNRYILVDAANEKRPSNDWTAMWVVGLSSDQNYYVLDMVRDRLNLTERADMLFRLHRKWRPMGVGYEQYGMMGDIAHIEDRQARENYRFTVTKLGGSMPKNDRIKRLIPDFEQGRWYLPESLHRTNYEKLTRDLVHDFVEEEYKAFPVASHDDMLDALARIYEEDMNLVWPVPVLDHRDDYGSSRSSGSVWAA